jgi:integrase
VTWTGSSARALSTWAHERQLGPAADLLIATLGADDAQVDYLGTILRRLVALNPVIQRWETERVPLHGLAELAQALSDDPGLVGHLPQRLSQDPVMSSFRGQASTHYLYMCWIVRAPIRAEAIAWLEMLRLWLLVQALHRAAGPQHCVACEVMEDACRWLREASEANEALGLLDALQQIETSTQDWYGLFRQLRDAEERFHSSPLDRISDQDRLLRLRLLKRITRGDCRPRKDAGATTSTRWIVEELTRQQQEQETWELPSTGDDDEATLIAPVSLIDDPDEDEDLGEVLVASDPEAPLASQELRGRYIQLLSGADARYLPWDWYVLTPPERVALEALCDRTIADQAPEKRLLAALVLVALKLGRSLELTSRVPLSPTNGTPSASDWTIDPIAGIASRAAPRRAGHWSPGEEQRARVRNFAEVLDVQLPGPAASVLAEAKSRLPRAETLADLWSIAGNEPLLAAFRHWRDTVPELQRITQGMLSQALGRDVYEETGDHVLSRLIASTSTSGLPAATAYTAYLGPPPGGSTPNGSLSALVDTNYAGGLLDPVDGFLRAGFASRHRDLQRIASSGDFLAFHNALTRYWDAAWRAATGIRPHVNRWRSVGAVDQAHDLQFVYVDDKPALQGARGRLVPLPAGFWARFRESYLEQHLGILRRWLDARGIAAPTLELDETSEAHRRPMLFLLLSKGNELQLAPVASDPEPESSVEFPLPANVYRHRLRTALHRAGADVEVIDSLLGHQDGATATHGDYSMRTWLTDAQATLPLLTQIFDEFDIQLPLAFDLALAQKSTHALQQRIESVTLRADASTPSRLRTRRLLKVRAVCSTRAILASELKVDISGQDGKKWLTARRLIDALADVRSSNILTGIGRRLMQGEAGAPTFLGPLRYAYFIELVDRVWEERDQRLPLTRRFIRRPVDTSPFRVTAAGARSRRDHLSRLLDEAVDGLVPSKLTSEEAVWLALFDLALVNRHVNRDLQAVLIERRPFRLVTFEQQCYLEWNTDGEIAMITDPIQRLRVTNRTTRALMAALTGKAHVVRWGSPPPARFEALATACTGDKASRPDLRRVLGALSDVVAQCNAIELPGTVAGYLSGRVLSTSLHWGEWLGLQSGRARDVRAVSLVAEDLEAKDDTQENDGTQGSAKRKARPRATPKALRVFRLEIGGALNAGKTQARANARPTPRPGGMQATRPVQSQLAARQFMRDVRRVLAETAVAKSGGAGVSDRRRTARRQIEGLVREQRTSTSSTMLLLAQWTASLFDRERAGKLVADSTVERYLAALSPRFEAAAYDRDLNSMDSDEIEELYAQILDLPFRGKARYPYARLREFHAFCERDAGLPAIDWSEVTPDGETKLCAPGFVDEYTYRRILIALSSDEQFETSELRRAAMALVVIAYRFGMRGGEVLGLRISDFRFSKSSGWMIIERNRARDLKTSAARRTLPLLHALRPLERRICECLIHSAVRAVTGRKGPGFLFPDADDPTRVLDGDRLKREVNHVIQQVSGKPHLSLHHFRHSFASRVWCELEGHQFVPPSLVKHAGWRDAPDKTRSALLGARWYRQTRRAPWALARVLGHSHPRVSWFSYIHFLDEAADQYARIFDQGDWPWPRVPSTGTNPLIDLAQIPVLTHEGARKPRLRQALKAVDMLWIMSDLDSGVPPAAIPAQYSCERAIVDRVARLVGQVRMRLPKSDVPQRATSMASGGIMGHVLASSLPALGLTLSSLYTDSARARLGEIRITEAEFVSMFGTARNISMFRRAQFLLVREVLILLEIPMTQMRIGAPANLPEEVARRAIRSGWRPDVSGDIPVPGRFDLPLDDSVQLDVATFQGQPLTQRIVFSLKRQADAPIGDRWEFMAALLATIPLLTFEDERD